MLKFLKFDISAEDRTGAAMGRVRSELKGIRGALASVSEQAARTGRSMRNIGGGMTAAITAPVAAFGASAVKAYDTQVKAEGAVQAALKSTGGAAGKTLGELKGLASGLQDVTTYGDEDILRNVTAPLLTFTKIQGETFDQAQAATLDMATLLKTDLKSASLLVGKALNDPVKGMAALSRSGVQLEDGQKSLIKSLVATGDVAGAQAVLLRELNVQFGEQAETAAKTPLGQWDQLLGKIGDVREDIGREIVPFLKPVMESVSEAVKWFGELDPAVKKNIVVFGGIAAAAGPILGVLGMATIGVGGLASAFTTLSAVLWANPIVAIIGAVAVGALLIYKNWDGITSYFSGLWENVKTSVQSSWKWIKDRFDLSWNPKNMIEPKWNALLGFFANLGPSIKAEFGLIWTSIKAEVGSWPERFKNFGLESAKSFVAGFGVLNLPAWLGGKAGGAAAEWGMNFGASLREGGGVTAGRNLGRSVVIGAQDEIARMTDSGGFKERLADTGGRLVQPLTDGAKDALGIKSPSKIFQGIGSDVVAGLVTGIAENGNAAVDEVRSLTQKITGEAKKAGGFLTSLRDGAKQAFSSVLTGASSLRGAVSQMLGGFGQRLLGSAVDGLFDAIWPNAYGNAFSNGRVTAFANGGVVSAPTFFGMRGGTGLMGEAGPEGILPLARTSGGKLGVHTTGGGRSGMMRVEVALDVPQGVTVEQVEQISGGVAVSVYQAGSQAQRAAMPATLSDVNERYT